MKKTFFFLLFWSVFGGLSAQQNILDFYKINDDRICRDELEIPKSIAGQMDLLKKFASENENVGRVLNPSDMGVGGKFVVQNFELPKNEQLVLKNDLLIWSLGDVILDGQILGEAIRNSNRDGQNLSIGAVGTIFVRGKIQLADGGAGQSCLRRDKKIHGSLAKFEENDFSKIENWTGGDGGSLLLFAKKIVFEGEISVGNGGRGFGKGTGGRGGDLAIFTDSLLKNGEPAEFFAGNGGDGGSEKGLGCGNGGGGGDAFTACSDGTNGAHKSGTGNMTGGAGGNGGAGMPFSVTGLSNGCAGGQGGSGTSTNGNGTGGKGGNGGAGGNITGPGGLLGGNGGGGGNGGNGIGGNGGIGKGGNGGNGGVGGSESYQGGSGGSAGHGTGGDGTNGGKGTGGNGGIGGNGGNAYPNGSFAGNGGQGGGGGNGYGGNSTGNVGNGGEGKGGNGGNAGNGGVGGNSPTYGGNGSGAGHGYGGNGLTGGNGFGGNGGNGGLSGGVPDQANYGGCTSPGGNGEGGDSFNSCAFLGAGGTGTGGYCGTSTHIPPLSCLGNPPCQGQSTNGQNSSGCSGVTVSNITAETATISWANCGATNYQLQSRRQGTSTWTSLTTATLSRNLTKLIHSTNYEFQIRSYCSGAWTGYRPIEIFTTGAGCSSTYFQSATATMNSFSVTWHAVPTNSGQQFQYRQSGTTAWTTTAVPTGDNTFATSNTLLASTIYQYRMRIKCGSAYKPYLPIQTIMTAATLLTGESRGEILEENFENEKPEADDFFEINLSPNPARDAVQILFSENFPFDSAHGTLEITDLNGKILQSISMENLIENGGWIVLKNFPKGISIVSVRPENGMPMTRKLVVD